ncbi:hypothetical protein CKN86_10745 [Carnobacterium divergens]|uniref:SDR family NAD(P)-dependent oxidoreductase n=1 Tax=Carnobacterium divergens TaxID=2748 RepID=UPI000D439687|nr:SDR family NAD(P)-dependent oxidoreductase [Carnobacterium divergens]MCO6017689.1 SDR family NAD(P)-dependent oxidoreductase [Carnobacterium divergens]TFI60892.1 hypothetical protein CKN62_10885 [Carnobacterium divergens]TFI87915.1 hypothetical protein CKN84_10775 [Carnobacterium divergens]TFJ02483.1 hypothetical protein CKN86_10745 [Carnobacterium divergens]TFJ03993.1 hypothetical protein CKN65_10785 [Carnobacterium divergens]
MIKSVLIIGPGSIDGLGMEIAKVFGNKGFKILTLSRNVEKLQKFKDSLAKENIHNAYWVSDIKNKQAVNQCLAEIIVLHDIELVVFNVSVRQPDDIVELSSEELLSSLETNATSVQNFINPLVPHLKKNSGAIITTGGGLGINPDYHKATLSIDKSVLRLITFLLHDQLQSVGVFVGTITVSATIKRNTQSDPAKIAPLYWEMFLNRKNKELLFEG